MKYDWDPEKAKSNLRRHRVSFEEAVGVFDDPNSLDKFDDAHSANERRFNLIGEAKGRLLFIVYTEEAADLIRIISARKATSYEKRQYFE